MKNPTTNELRQAYLDFFKSKGHSIIPGASLVPENDPTVLFTTAGMHPLVPYLLGEPHPGGKRLVDVQLCVRTQDIDEVGDSSHLTCFEMLGNWSLGDYFKEGAIAMSFEYLTKILKLPIDRLAVSVFEGDKDAPRDDESAEIWRKLGIPEERIAYLPKAKNWWGPAGQTGPCGPDTEMFYWVGEGEPQGNPKTHDAEWLEIWNDVFMQYFKNEDGTFKPLAQRNVDTGMGLERVAAVMQGVKSVYETDAFKPIMKQIEDTLNLQENYAKFSPQEKEENQEKVDKQFTKHSRIICDHLKAAIFIVADGVHPSNVDQGYVLRRLIRRAIRSAWRIAKEAEQSAFTTPIVNSIIDSYGNYYSNLSKKRNEICSVIALEEEQFKKTLGAGLKHVHKLIDSTVNDPLFASKKMIDGVAAFTIFETYGFPLELTKEIAAERGFSVDEAQFQKAFEAHQILSRAGAEKRFAGGLADHSAETTKLHTATHLLNAALRKVLGDHVYQKGSNVTAERLRFDFPHPEKLTPEQIKQVEDLVNQAIKADLPVSYHVTTVDGAKNEGAIGVFGERYGSEVKVYVMGNAKKGIFSKEICGGPHVAHTGVLGTFKIQKEESSSAGVRRIKAVVSDGPSDIDTAGEDRE